MTFHQRITQLSHDRLTLLALELHERLEAQVNPAYAPIAVIGMACRFPGGVHDADSYWRLLKHQGDGVIEVPPDRWDLEAIYDPSPEARGKTYSRHGGFLEKVDAFDAEFFGLSPREAMSMDPQQRLLLEVAWEALENANLPADGLVGSNAGVFLGAGANDYSHLLPDPALVDGYALTGNALNALAGRISYILGWHGPSLVIDTACSSSLVAVHLAALSLHRGEARVALAGGVNLMLVPYPTIVASRLRMLAPDGRCKTFDAAADGFVRGEGCGIVVLKPLADAERDGDRVLAVLRSSAVNQDGASSGFTVPNGLAQQSLIREALRRADISAEQIQYVEAHGTGTELGDPIEIQSLHEVLGRRRQAPLYVGSVKSNFGHLESAAGIAGFIKAVLSLKNREIPGQLHFRRPTPLFDWDRSCLQVPRQTLPWPRAERGFAAVSSFGVSGTNAHVILEEACEAPSDGTFVSDDVQMLTISAKDPSALRELAARYASDLEGRPASEFAEFCHTANTGRARHEWRASLVGKLSEIQSGLQTIAAAHGPTEMRLLLESLAQTLDAGGNPRFASLQAAGKHRRLTLPTYPFQRQRYWLEETSARPATEVADLVYDLEWRRKEASAAPESVAGGSLPRESGCHFEASTGGHDPWERLTFECERFLHFIHKAVAEAAPAVLVTHGAWRVLPGDSADPVQAALWGAARVLMSEHPGLHVTLVDLPAESSTEEEVELLRRELRDGSAREQVAYRNGVRYVARLRRAPAAARRKASILASGTYLVTGGKGGVGTWVLNWLAQRGAGRVVILTRNPPGAEFQRECELLTTAGHAVEIELGDVASPEDVARVLLRCGPLLKGIFHLAGVVDDAVLTHQTNGHFERVLAPKARGAWNLHQQTLNYDLDHFVLFSSATALLGAPGQANYAAANAFLDALAQLRQAAGLPASSIQWGPWAGTGMSRAASDAAQKQRPTGVRALAPQQALATLEQLLGAPGSQPQMAPQMVLGVDWSQLRDPHFAPLPLWEEHVPPAIVTPTLAEQVAGLTAAAAREQLRREVAQHAASILRRTQPLSGSVGFFDAGMDSLMALELRNGLQSRLGKEVLLPTSLLFDHPTPDKLGDHLAQVLGVLPLNSPAAPISPFTDHERVAVIGIGCRFPGGIDAPQTYWRSLLEGIDAITEIPRQRWDVDAYYDPDPQAPGKMVSRCGGFLDEIDQFDAGFFGIAPREALHMDPQQRLLLEVAWEALEDAGIAADQARDHSVGVFVGISSNDYLRLLEDAVQRGDAYLGAGNALSASAGRLSYVMSWNGPSMAVDTACSSSLVAVHLAIQALRERRCRMAVAAGVNLILTPESNVQLSKSRMLSPDGRCKVFDAKADGYVRGEGCGVVVLKRLSDALADGDRIWAVIRGSAMNQDGRTAGLTVPSGPAQAAVIAEALADAALGPHDVHYVEAHGTGTSLGDPIELQSIASAYAGSKRPGPLLVGSVKANLGHLEAAAGIAGLIKAILVVHHGTVPAQPHFHSPTPHFDWDSSSLLVPTAPRALRGDATRRAGVSSFGFVGTNAHLVLESPPPSAPLARELPPPLQVLTLSARTLQALKDLRERFLRELSSGAAWEDVCHTANTGRARFSHRLALTARDAAEAQRKLSTEEDVYYGALDSDAPVRLAFLLPEQHVTFLELQTHGIWRLPAFQDVWRSSLSNLDIRDAERLESSALGFVLTYALLELARSWGIQPAVAAGQGLGDIAAGCCAGALSWKEGWEFAQSIRPGAEARVLPDAPAALDVRWLRASSAPAQGLKASGCGLVAVMGLHLAEPSLGELGVPVIAPFCADDLTGLYDAFAQLFVSGVFIDWSGSTATTNGRKITLPTYPFQRQRYWPEGSARAARPAGRAPSSHPLLGQRLHSPAFRDVVFESQVTAQSPGMLNDHRVYDQAILSGPTQLSMVLDAARRVFPEGAYIVSDVTFLQPNLLSETAARTLQVILQMAEDRAAFRIVSAPCEQEDLEAAWVVHSTGQVRWAPVPSERLQPHQEWLRGDQVRVMAGQDFYREIQQVGFAFGPTFRWIDELRYERGRSCATLRAADGTERDVFGVHPGLADSCFQALAAATGFDQAFAERGEAYVPAVVGEVRMFRRCGRARYCLAALRFDHGYEDMTVGDWTLIDEDGQVLLEATGLHLQRAPRETLFRALAPRTGGNGRRPPIVELRPEAIEARVRQEAIAVLGLADDQPLGPRETLFELGLDSLMAVDLRERLEAALARKLPATLLFDYPTTGDLTQYLLGLVAAPTTPEAAAAPVEPTSDAEILELQEMSEEELNSLVLRELDTLLQPEK